MSEINILSNAEDTLDNMDLNIQSKSINNNHEYRNYIIQHFLNALQTNKEIVSIVRSAINTNPLTYRNLVQPTTQEELIKYINIEKNYQVMTVILTGLTLVK